MTAEGEPTKPIRLFYSYSHRDEDLRLKLQEHLAILKWNGMIAEWNDRDIEAGTDWEEEIDQHLSTADIILLLISASFIASQYCWSVEVKKALERHKRGEARVIPVILRPCRWQSTPFARLQATPRDAKPVTAWPDPDAAFDDVVGKIEAVVRELSSKPPRMANPGNVPPNNPNQIIQEKHKPFLRVVHHQAATIALLLLSLFGIATPVLIWSLLASQQTAEGPATPPAPAPPSDLGAPEGPATPPVPAPPSDLGAPEGPATPPVPAPPSDLRANRQPDLRANPQRCTDIRRRQQLYLPLSEMDKKFLEQSCK